MILGNVTDSTGKKLRKLFIELGLDDKNLCDSLSVVSEAAITNDVLRVKWLNLQFSGS